MDINALYDRWIPFVIENFTLVMFVLALIFFVFERLIQKIRRVEGGYVALFRWIALFPLAATGFYVFTMQIFFQEMVAKGMGAEVSIFQFDAAAAFLTLGILGLCSFCSSYGFRFATTLAATTILWINSAYYLNMLSLDPNFQMVNVNSWVWLNFLTPLVMWICIGRMNSDACNSAPKHKPAAEE